ncbi:FMN-linked oxidoreductase [Artomyces pyxidatus]|uniref:FMN-linked oxidoreductase n=1 Tax=Artomyces pyxidatus TaxID=48021 RepID=A0ACB8TEG6_9AGAM|nr:FMN-linked oxidoreductase [Artomyces pyxidatus]
MYEHLASLFGGPPNAAICSLYAQWAKGEWGMILTGNVQISGDHLTLGRDMVVPQAITQETIQLFAQLAERMRPPSVRDNPRHVSATAPLGTAVVMQLSHAGRQSPTILGGRLPFIRALAPSSIGLSPSRTSSPSAKDGWFSQLVYALAFPKPRAMSLYDIEHVVDGFVRGAKLALDAGFDGIELHASHGYLLAQFISPRSNERHDAYNAQDEPLHLLHQLISTIRAVVPSQFIVGVKVSSADYVEAGSSPSVDTGIEDAIEERALGHVIEISTWEMVDFIEISGGDYENPAFMTTSRQVFFSRFSRKARPANLSGALEDGHADLLGIGRGSVLCPELPRLLRGYANLEHPPPSIISAKRSGSEGVTINTLFPQLPELSSVDTPLARAWHYILSSLGILPLPKLIGAGVGMAWYVAMISRLSRGKHVDYSVGGLGAIARMWATELRLATASAAIFVILLLCIGRSWLC